MKLQCYKDETDDLDGTIIHKGVLECLFSAVGSVVGSCHKHFAPVTMNCHKF